jgi:hypothetical protein
MYDYISLYSDDNYSGKINTEVIEEYLQTTLNLLKKSSLKFVKELDEVKIIVTGILADANGNYAFDTLDGINEINLIEIGVPDGIDKSIEDEILKIAFAIAKKFSWCVYDNETSSKICP